MFKVDRRQMERIMRQMGIKTRELEGVKEVLIRMEGKEISIQDPQVTLTEMAGQRSYQVTGREVERSLQMQPSEEDIKLVMEQTGATKEAAVKAISEANGDLAEAIMLLKKGATSTPAP
ncbi:MAG: nascent polypeptide-associated complex protein [Candidatus Hadarchaeales archaeon]